jgi:transcriptional regulator with XRE-family HTH domain
MVRIRSREPAATIVEDRPQGKAIKGIRALRTRMAAENPAFAAAVDMESQADSFCRMIRASLREQRMAQNLDQSEIAARLDMTQSAVSKIENGEGDIGMKTIFRYAQALGLLPMYTFMVDSRRLFPAEAAAAIEAVENFKTDIVNSASQAVSDVVSGLARTLKY